MFTLTKQPPAAQSSSVHRLRSLPRLAEIHYYVDEALTKTGTPVTVTWTAGHRFVNFELRILWERGLRWQLSCGVAPRMNLLWERVTADVVLMYNLIALAGGEEPQTEDAEGTLRTNQDSIEAAWWNTRIDGQLSLCSIAQVLKSFASKAASGTMLVKSGTACGTVIHFERGAITHAYNARHLGVEAVYDLLSASSGEYDFDQYGHSAFQTVFTNIDTILDESQRIQKREGSLRRAGWSPTAIIVRQAHLGLSFASIAQCLSLSGSDLDMHTKMYLAIDEKRTAEQLASCVGLTRSDWIRVLAQMHAANLITFLPF